MAEQFPEINETFQRFIEAQHMFFVGTAADEGRVNISPKGMDSLRVLGPNRVVWRNGTGSGNETAGHLARINRMTLMWCSFGPKPLILRLYGSAQTIHPRDAEWDELNSLFEPWHAARQIYDMSIDLVQSSCGYAVPRMEFASERDTLKGYWAQRDEAAIETYWTTRNTQTIDGLPTGIAADDS